MAVLATLSSVAPYHLLVYSALFGATSYQSFYAGIVAYKVLPLNQFATLQSHIFPAYFTFQAAASAFLLLTPPFAFGAAAYTALGGSLTGGIINAAYLGPKSNRIKTQRDARVELEGKSYKDPTASDEMKKLNKQFGATHGISVLLNLIGWAGLVFYGILLTEGLSAKSLKK
ncbi:hypothetical protein AWJ20_1810 [Sugiyamaella lignohabitans]|uniref:TMEM205-like domain-containing protein n=1 Tax=Sugiyamaella lignohabitans TaxID=796027 RepID=A0A167E0T8_9ASCO|nr:uncharacterized protein AWJ20_1810 [Sugiyamaella lignohabitans]ANB13515.1 hypothetical protein AWJ20_1810 [Sugiyamaella lignohabitans]